MRHSLSREARQNQRKRECVASVSLQAESSAEPTRDAVYVHLIFEDRPGRTENIRHPIDQPVDADVKRDVLAETVADHHLELARGFLFLGHSITPSRAP